MTDTKPDQDRSPAPAKDGPAGGGGRPQRQSGEPGKKPRREVEIGGPKGPEPTRYGDWERMGIASDF